MRYAVQRVVVLQVLFATLSLQFTPAQEPPPARSIIAKEPTARLLLKEKSSVFSIELSARLPEPLAAILTAKIVAPDDKVRAESSTSLKLDSSPHRFEVLLSWAPQNGLGRSYVARVWATRPDSDKPVPGVARTGFLGDEDEAATHKELMVHTKTNFRGEALLTFHFE